MNPPTVAVLIIFVGIPAFIGWCVLIGIAQIEMKTRIGRTRAAAKEGKP